MNGGNKIKKLMINKTVEGYNNDIKTSYHDLIWQEINRQ